MNQKPRSLQPEQLAHFDKEVITGSFWDVTKDWISSCFPSRSLSLLDIGGGNGHFADSILDSFSESTCTILDNGESLISRNRPHPRKVVICDSAENSKARLKNSKFDLISLNWVLHHLVDESYAKSRELQARILRLASEMLSPNGRILVFECLYEGLLVDFLPGRLIYELTSSRKLAPLISKLGANTAGCGVCFLNLREWRKTFRRSNLGIHRFYRHENWKVGFFRQVGLTIRSVCDAQFLLKPLYD